MFSVGVCDVTDLIQLSYGAKDIASSIAGKILEFTFPQLLLWETCHCLISFNSNHTNFYFDLKSPINFMSKFVVPKS